MIVAAKIIKVFEPVTMSPVMRVQLDGERPAVLKLYDRRFGPLMRKNSKIPPWNLKRERLYRQFVESGGADRFISYLNNDDGEDDGDWTDAQEETFLYDKCCDLYDAETMVYNTLCSLQGTSIPELLGTVSLQTYITDDPEAQKYFEIRGVILEDCDGFSLDKLADNAPTGCWQSICDDAVSIVNSISDQGILNKDVKPESFVIRKISSNGSTMYRPVMIDFALCRARALYESHASWRQEKRSQDEEGAVGFVMQQKLRKRGGYYRYKPSYRYDDD
jgi:serine/threonine protein kinase